MKKNLLILFLETLYLWLWVETRSIQTLIKDYFHKVKSQD